ncbi:MAG: AAA family ATPase [Shimia sp.]
MSSTAIQGNLTPLRACTVCRDVQDFDLLIEDMEALLGETWGDLTFEEALAYLDQPEAEGLEFIAVALDDTDEAMISLVVDVISSAKMRGIKVLLVAEDLGTATLHLLMKNGAAEFIPYPLPEQELAQAIERLNAPEPEAPAPVALRNTLAATGDQNGAIFPVHGLGGGSGASTMAVNLAWELANVDPKAAPRVCLLDLDLQFGSVATSLDLPRRDAVLELLQDTESMDHDSFMQGLLSYNDRLHVLTSPADIVPLDLVGPADIGRILDCAAANFDYVIVDMPTTLVEWTETVLTRAHVYFATLELDMRCAHNAVRMKKMLQGEDLPFDKMRYAVNRAPKMIDMAGRGRVKQIAELLNTSIDILLPDGGKQVPQVSDHGQPLAIGAAKNPLRKEFQRLAQSLHDISSDTAKAA